MVVELVVPILKDVNHFSIQGLGGKMLIFGYWVKTIPAGCRFAAPAGKNQNSDKHHIFAPTAGARRTIFYNLFMLIEVIETIKKVSIIFWSNA